MSTQPTPRQISYFPQPAIELARKSRAPLVCMKPRYKLYLDGRVCLVLKPATDVESVLERMRRALGAASFTELAEMLGQSEQTFRVWVHRRRVPARVILRVALASGLSVGWLEFGVRK